MSTVPTRSTQGAPLVVEDDQKDLQARILALEQREQRVSEAEQLTRNSNGNRIMMDGKMVPVFILAQNDSYAPLEDSVALASKAELERVLLRVCSVSEVARAVATEMLPVIATNTAPGRARSSKRKASGAETINRCSRCKMRFETDESLPKDCRYHPGSKYLNEDAEWSDDGGGGGGLFWDDHDEKTFGSAEFLEDHEDYQEGFLWSCCEQRGDAEGCKAREHDVWVKRANS